MLQFLILNKPRIVLLLGFLVLLLMCTIGNTYFSQRTNPVVLLIVTFVFAGVSLDLFANEPSRTNAVPASGKWGWLHALIGFLSFLLLYEELRKTWVKYPNPGKISDVLPQLEAMSTWLFSGQNPYQPVVLPTHTTFPVYMPLHFSPLQISQVMGIDIRWSGVILLVLAMIWVSYELGKTTRASLKVSLPALLLFSLPVWIFIYTQSMELSISLETIVCAWYLLLAGGLITRNHLMITVGLIGALLSRYSGLFWMPLFAVLLWLYVPRVQSFRVWLPVIAAFLVLFAVPFWLRDLQLHHKILDYYQGCTHNSWVFPDEYTFLAGLSMNIHLREWIPGDKEVTLHYSHYPQLAMQLLVAGLAIWYYLRKGKDKIDIYSYALVFLFLMVMLFYSFSPMLFGGVQSD